MIEFFIEAFILKFGNLLIYKKLAKAEILVTIGFSDYVLYVVNSAFAFDFVIVTNITFETVFF